MPGRAIRIFLTNGTPSGLRTAELGLSTCKAVMAPRIDLEALSRRSEARRTGVYILVGDDEKHIGRRAVYIGEGDEVFTRIKSHDSNKDFWDQVILFVSKDENLTKAHVRYLEARMIMLATEARRATVTNGTAPDPSRLRLPEADQAEMEEYLEHVRMLASTLGVVIFENMATELPTRTPMTNEIRVSMSGTGYNAHAVVRGGQLVVLQGSLARKQEAPSLSASSRALRAELIDAEVLAAIETGLQFTQDYAFDSPSGAAQAIAGASVNGRITWRLPDERTLKDWQDAQIAEIEP
ncbi:GIY-YIG nuclease family protein [Nannocystaceae bacterium ST9]